MRRFSADVIVVGGGVAGLAAAAELGRGGARVVLMEARDRLGGRILTQRIPGWPCPVELGAQFVHAGNPALWALLRRNRIGTRNVPPRHWRFRGDAVTKIEDVAAEIARVTGEIKPRRMQGWSFADFLRRTDTPFAAADREVAAGFVEGFEAAPMDQMSAVAIAGETLDDEDQFVVPSGYDRVVTALIGELSRTRVTVVCNSPVRRIHWRHGAVEVQSPKGEAKAAAAIVTLPIGMWHAARGQRGAIAFTPELREKHRIARQIGVGHVIRINLRIDARRWPSVLPEPLRRARRGGFGFVHSRIEGLPVWWSLSSDSVLTGWAGGPAALELAHRSSGGVFERALRSLTEIFGAPKSELRDAVLDFATHNWTSDPFSRGAYSFIKAGHDDAAERLRAPVQDTLFLAGEATADGEEVGTVHGALSSGLRAAAEVGSALR